PSYPTGKMKDYQALNPNPSPSVGSVDSVDIISLKIYKLSILYHSKKKYRCCQKSLQSLHSLQ
ncbi:MAG: hypothetical protein J6J70_00590, partial [Methanocorpusculaceae archaeon]|nr:hypothetical protein [Methanocorpusculaceae archaeon]